MSDHNWKNEHGVPENWEDFEKFIKEYPQDELSELLEFSDVLILVAEGEAERHRWQTWQMEYYKHVPSERFFAVMTCVGNTESQDGEYPEYQYEVIEVEVTRLEYKQKA